MSADQPRRARQRTALDASRRAAFQALLDVEIDDAYLNLALPKVLEAQSLGGVDAAFATELAYGTARMRGTYDAILAMLVAGGLGALQPQVLVALRLGVHQELGMRVPSHAAVGTSVELVRESVGERPVRMVNAVLRKVGSAGLDAWLGDVAPSLTDDPIGGLAVMTSHPTWVVTAFREALQAGEELAVDSDVEISRAKQALDADNVPPQVSLAVRPGLQSVDDLVAAGCERGRWSPFAATLPSGDPSSLEAVRSGRAGVQDEGSQLAALALARAPVEGADARWLDLCAGPGGKSALLRGLANERGAALLSARAAAASRPARPVGAARIPRPSGRCRR